MEQKRTDNGCKATEAGSADLEMFFNGFLRNTEADRTAEMMAAAWEQNPRRAVALVFQARDCRGGKGEKRSPMDGMLWLRKHHPSVYELNLGTFARDLGCYRDLLELAGGAVEAGQAPLGRKGELVELKLLATALAEDWKRVAEWRAAGKAGRVPGLSLAAKWAPSSKSKYDRKDGADLVRRLARLVVGRSPTMRADYRRRLSALREHLGLVERLMSAGQWEAVDFSRVPSRAMKRYRAAFTKRQQERFAEFLQGAMAGTTKIAHAAVHPHELVKVYLDGGDLDPAIEAQWKASLDAHRARLEEEGGGGALAGAVPVVDVSGSMYNGTAIYAAVALGLFMAETATGAFHRRVLTFSETPGWHLVQGDTLHAQVASLKKAHWGYSTAVHKLFALVAEKARLHKVPQCDMPRSLFILSDMQFDTAVGRGEDQTALEDARRRFREAKYEVPDVVFWNLATPSRKAGAPAEFDTRGVTMLSGFSQSAFHTVATHGITTPGETVAAALAKYEEMVRGVPE